MKKILINLILLSLVAFTLTSCHKDKILYEDTVTFTDQTWLRQEPKSFNIQVKNIDDCYNIYFTMKIDTASVRGNNFPLVVNLYSENGERRMFYSYLQVRNNEGNWIVPREGSKLIIDQRIKEYFFFNSVGQHRLEIGQGTDRYEIKKVEYFGVRIEKAELIYPE